MNHFKPRCRSVIDNVTDKVTTSGACRVGVPIRGHRQPYNVPPTGEVGCRQEAIDNVSAGLHNFFRFSSATAGASRSKKLRKRHR
jgi:hypothetical protein